VFVRGVAVQNRDINLAVTESQFCATSIKEPTRDAGKSTITPKDCMSKEAARLCR
jgi:hypothetical protein